MRAFKLLPLLAALVSAAYIPPVHVHERALAAQAGPAELRSVAAAHAAAHHSGRAIGRRGHGRLRKVRRRSRGKKNRARKCRPKASATSTGKAGSGSGSGSGSSGPSASPMPTHAPSSSSSGSGSSGGYDDSGSSDGGSPSAAPSAAPSYDGGSSGSSHEGSPSAVAPSAAPSAAPSYDGGSSGSSDSGSPSAGSAPSAAPSYDGGASASPSSSGGKTKPTDSSDESSEDGDDSESSNSGDNDSGENNSGNNSGDNDSGNNSGNNSGDNDSGSSSKGSPSSTASGSQSSSTGTSSSGSDPLGSLGGLGGLSNLLPGNAVSSWTVADGDMPLSSFMDTVVKGARMPQEVTAPDGSPAQLNLYAPGKVGYDAGGFNFYSAGTINNVDPTKAKEMVFSFSVMFPEDFDWVNGGKLPGLFGGTSFDAARHCSGGQQRDDCFSARVMWRADGAGEAYDYFPGKNNNYCQEKTNPDGTTNECNPQYGDSVHRGAFHFKAGAWNQIQHRILLNDPDQANAEQELLIDGKSVIKVTGIKIRNADNVRIQGIMGQTFFGGSDPEKYAPKTEQKAFFKDWSLATLSLF